jgi:hypothetical protein
MGLIWPLGTFTQKGEGANVGVGSPWQLGICFKIYLYQMDDKGRVTKSMCKHLVAQSLTNVKKGFLCW